MEQLVTIRLFLEVMQTMFMEKFQTSVVVVLIQFMELILVLQVVIPTVQLVIFHSLVVVM